MVHRIEILTEVCKNDIHLIIILKALLMTEVNSKRFVDVDLRFIKPC